MIIVLLLLLIVGVGFRVTDLNAIGFAEDEVNKVDAVRAYEKGDITANGEHPMLMKALMFASAKIGRKWQVSDEILFRLPNAIIGALTILPLFLLTAAFFDRWTGLLAAAFWAVGVNAITINRVGKEDSLLVFFMLFAFYFYLRAKQTDTRQEGVRKRYYILSGASFGLMIASKYFPHYLGLNSLYHHYSRVRRREPGEPAGKTALSFYVAMLIAFLIANPAVLMPSVWEYMNSYMGEKLLAHTGYLFGDHVYKNTISASPFWGTPIYFYLLLMAIKIPVPVLVAFVTGLFVSVKNRRHPGHAFVLFMFLFWIVPYSLIGAKWLRYTLSLMPFIYMLAAIGVVWLFRQFASKLTKSESAAGSLHSNVHAIVAAVAVVLFMVLPAWSACTSAPHYALYTNAVGAKYMGYFFPHDEFYDDGLREAIKFVCDNAGPGATIAHETPATTRYYLERFGRTDLISKTISSSDFDPTGLPGPAYLIVQRGRTYFENQQKLQLIRTRFRKVHEITIRGLPAAEIFVNQTEGNSLARSGP